MLAPNPSKLGEMLPDQKLMLFMRKGWLFLPFIVWMAMFYLLPSITLFCWLLKIVLVLYESRCKFGLRRTSVLYQEVMWMPVPMIALKAGLLFKRFKPNHRWLFLPFF